MPGGPLAQSEIWHGYFAPRLDGDPVAERIFRSAGVQRRHAAVNPLVEDVSRWSTERRMRRYLAEGLPLGKEAVGSALDDAGLRPDEVGLLAVISCTGYTTPGLDIHVAADLGMATDVQRLIVGHMGCYAAIPGLGAVADFVVARGRPAVALCLELHPAAPAAAHRRDGRIDRGQVVSHALFGDAAAAVVVAARRSPGRCAGGRGRRGAHRSRHRRPHDLGRHGPRVPDGPLPRGARGRGAARPGNGHRAARPARAQRRRRGRVGGAPRRPPDPKHRRPSGWNCPTMRWTRRTPCWPSAATARRRRCSWCSTRCAPPGCPGPAGRRWRWRSGPA